MMTKQTAAAFVALLERCKAQFDRCKAQVQADPSGFVNNPHLYDQLENLYDEQRDQLHRIYLRLCHGNIPDHGEGPVGLAPKRGRPR